MFRNGFLVHEKSSGVMWYSTFPYRRKIRKKFGLKKIEKIEKLRDKTKEHWIRGKVATEKKNQVSYDETKHPGQQFFIL